ncbi:mechanosensitive ion channel family protein [Hydrogenovibrio sp. JE_KL2]|jgi:small conductance mechanosensitive channel|uniref:mechanosensitive ion channel family protein n=1 Tax=Hydrogenovibrio sp. JE_KL2 TaxID=2651188 RepID=UPI00128C9375|nr:mechanosensitive ion channel domain-containing protein [Hydrogenovibrio sp. JE_KL2]MPQ76890.1 mechanosensitive ion channel [Hydrogenovibrio sp. JE_KL2]
MTFENLVAHLDIETLWDTVIIPWGSNILFAILIFFIGKSIANILIKLLKKGLQKASVDPMLSNFVVSVSKTLLLLLIIIAALSQLGVNTASLIALIGAAGLAIGLALQNSLQNFAAGVLLLVFKHFKVGDVVEIGGKIGTVEAVGIFSTTLRTGDNKTLIMPNGAIYSGSITNFSTKPTRRVDMTFGIGYDDDIKKAKSILEQLVQEDERILKDPQPTIALSELGDSSINFIVRPWVNAADYWAVLWDMNEKVKLAFDDAGISIPYPQMDVHLHTETKTEN